MANLSKSEALPPPPAAPAVPLPAQQASDAGVPGSQAYVEATRAAQAHQEAYQVATGGAAYPLVSPAMESHEDLVGLLLTVQISLPAHRKEWKQIDLMLGSRCCLW
jgi:hypothetical protein